MQKCFKFESQDITWLSWRFWRNR